MTIETSNRLPILADEIKRAHGGVMDAATTAAERAIEAGNALIEAKLLVKHGQWLPFLKEHCELPERTAQLYMKIARLGLEPATVADLGIKMLAKTKGVFRDPGYHPFADCDEDQERQWMLFCLHGAPWHHVEWVLQRGFVTPDEWIGDEGEAYRKRFGMRQFSKAFKLDWQAFRKKRQDWSLDEINQMLAAETTATSPATAHNRNRARLAQP
jgi:hypothetical protein